MWLETAADAHLGLERPGPLGEPMEHQVLELALTRSPLAQVTFRGTGDAANDPGNTLFHQPRVLTAACFSID